MGADERRRPARLTGGWWSVLLIIGLGLALQAGPAGAGEKILAQLPLDKVESLATVLTLDSEITAEGKSAVKIISPGPASICLGLIENLQVEDAGQAYKLVYQAQVRARDLKGNAFLEMWCFFGSDGPYFSRGLKVNQGKKSPRTMARELTGYVWRFRSAFMRNHISSVAEIWDGLEPDLPKGCPAQAWSVMALLLIERTIKDLEAAR